MLTSPLAWVSHDTNAYLFIYGCANGFIYFYILIELQYFGGWGHRGHKTLNFEHGQDFLTMHLLTKFDHPIFNRSQVIVFDKQTNTQTNTQTNAC